MFQSGIILQNGPQSNNECLVIANLLQLVKSSWHWFSERSGLAFP